MTSGLCLVALLVGCGGSDRATSVRDVAPTIGFIYVGSVHDRGYNEAAHAGAVAVERALPAATVLERQNVPETAAVATVMKRMIARGATIIFPTSFGYLPFVLNVAARHPDVTFLHQGGLQTARNVGTYFGTIWEAEYAAGQAAGLATRSDRLGFVAAFPIAQSLLSINAYALGAQSVNPRVRTEVVFTRSWCAPAEQQTAARDLLARGADVLTQHQDCTRTVIEDAARAGALTTGYHYDARSVAPDAWLTGVAWNWGPLYVDMVRTIVAGKFAGSPYAGRFRGGATEGIVRLASFGEAATPSIRRRVSATFAAIGAGTLQPFHGPVRDQAGRVRITGAQPPITQLEETDYLVKGVIGRLPAG